MLFLHYRVILWLNLHVTFRMSLNEIVLLYTYQFIGDKVDVEDPLKKKRKMLKHMKNVDAMDITLYEWKFLISNPRWYDELGGGCVVFLGNYSRCN